MVRGVTFILAIVVGFANIFVSASTEDDGSPNTNMCIKNGSITATTSIAISESGHGQFPFPFLDLSTRRFNLSRSGDLLSRVSKALSKAIPELFLEHRRFGQAGRDYDREPLPSPESETAPAAWLRQR
ncbi:hypothetical protein QBC40DRAFT_298037 [Triangularia verruculosa]|uniref:Uncharacterized protein n=1 Tax=Triangularia verruculosa TaxID=2587418 RepID=A0AAN6XGC5_9PEZI|nr:hypothetical protein QBC40DRAFT_298037 [Triangularia verruculosa]